MNPEILGEDWLKVQGAVKDALGTDVGILARTNERILSHGGKMLRPMCSLLVAKALGKPGKDSIRFAAASELLHNATLLHDDVADKSDTRRGNPTVCSLLGARNAVLVGDFWLSRAVGCVTSSRRRDKVVGIFTKTLSDLAEGEMLQLEKSMTLDTTEEDYFRIIYCKTASLFEAACVAGALSVDAPEEKVEAARKYAVAMGLAFQIKDDILDYEGTGELGKPVGEDIREKKITLPLLGAAKNAGKDVRKLMRSADVCPWKALKFRRFVRTGGGVQYASEVLEKYVEQACEALKAFPEGPERDCLEQIARFNSIRKK